MLMFVKYIYEQKLFIISSWMPGTLKSITLTLMVRFPFLDLHIKSFCIMGFSNLEQKKICSFLVYYLRLLDCDGQVSILFIDIADIYCFDWFADT